ncbi:MAG: ABC transporter substrate-binding protein [Chloroflexi bacterium]|nr:ABC transporter substrate-binding protein [Chloroflexota bacterium]
MPGRRLVHGFHQALMEPLFILNYETGEIEPWLGQSMTPNESFDVWTLKLRQGVKWSDGEDFNADDVVFSIKMLLEKIPNYAYIYSDDMKNWVESVEKLDDLTVQFTMLQPNTRFQLDFFSVQIWTNPNIVPEHIWQDQDPLSFKNYDPEKGWPVFTGPYKIESVSETEFVYVRDDNWWGAQIDWRELPKPKRIIWTWYGSEEERMSAMVNNELDSLLDISLGNLLELRALNPHIITHFEDLPYAWVPDPCARNFELNHTMTPWDDKEMRWALNYIIDRDEIVAFAYNGTTIASRHFFPAYPPLNSYVDLLEEAGLYEKYPLLKHSPEKARGIIETKGYTLNGNGYYEKDGQELSIDLTTHAGFIEKQRIAQVIVEQLQQAGINATTRNEDATTWYNNFELGNFETRIGWQSCGSVNEPWGSMNTFNTRWLKPVGERTGENQNAWRWSGETAERYSALVDEIHSLPVGDPKVDELFVEAMEIWLDELPIIPLTQARKIMPFNTTYWTGWPTADNNYIHHPTWWQSAHIIIHNLELTQP